ncbi:Bacitracin transport ATP-binding protein BcrA [Paenibacillus allorhizoplanae]|uniref:Bacitracin transport ATP-binding protein BcrA n=1 Tax=Paenibacillus allorhizoplanae TaxID=2905648 RepID=A0ABN8H8I2_9BACL|nr:ABC transporter ATP-binding protein [Paenibacillus allorhizoplanae]CAH1227401.1 Bacitracin transport ATP-binding protein BcrA [Paenibacillus allorhizoplanae]
MSIILQTKQLSKLYKKTEVVSGVNMRVRRGEIYGFLGPNGAGKTTVMRMLTNLIPPTSGEIELFGAPLTPHSYETMKRMGSIIEYPIFYDHLTARANLELHCEYMGYYDKNAISETLDLVGLSDIGNKPVKDFSLGMKQRLGIGRAICTKPELLILDEPVNGMDPSGIREIRDLFRMLSKEFGMTLLISSHILQEIEQLADTIGVINHGKLLEEVSMEQVRGRHNEYTEIVVTDVPRAVLVLEDKLAIVNYKIMDNSTIRIYDPRLAPVELNRLLVQHEIGVEALNKKTRSLEDYFLGVIEGGNRDALEAH